MGRKILLGFAGPGKVSDNNIKDLLKDYLGFGEEDKKGLPTFADDVDEVRVIIPASQAMLTPTVERLWEWTDAYADLPYEVIYKGDADDIDVLLDRAEEAIKSRNVVATMVDRLIEGKKDGYEVSVIVAWGETGDDDTEMLVDLALAKELAVKGLDQGMDDLHFGSEAEPEPEPESEKPTRRTRRSAAEAPPEEAVEDAVEEEKPRRRRGTPRKTAETAPEAAEAVQEESVEAEVSHARQRAQKAPEGTDATPIDTSDDIILQALIASFNVVKSLDSCHAAMTLRGKPVDSALTSLLRAAIEKHTAAPADPADAPEDTSPRGGRPRADGTPARKRTAQQKGVKEFQNEDGDWIRAGRGRLPKDVPVRTVDPKTGAVIEE